MDKTPSSFSFMKIKLLNISKNNDPTYVPGPGLGDEWPSATFKEVSLGQAAMWAGATLSSRE